MPKKNLIVLGGGIAVLVIAAIVALWLTVWAPPSKQDFEHAKTEVSKLESKYGELSTTLQAYASSFKSTNSAGSKSALANYDKAVKSVDTSFETLDGSKAARNDQVKAALDSLVKKQEYIQEYSDGYLLYSKSFAACTDVFDVTKNATDGKSIAAAHKKAATDCLPVLTAMKKSSIPYFSNYAKNYSSAIQKRQSVFDGYAAKKLSDSEASSKITEIAQTDLKAVLGSDDGLMKARQNATAFEALQELKKVIDQKIKQS